MKFYFVFFIFGLRSRRTNSIYFSATEPKKMTCVISKKTINKKTKTLILLKVSCDLFYVISLALKVLGVLRMKVLPWWIARFFFVETLL